MNSTANIKRPSRSRRRAGIGVTLAVAAGLVVGGASSASASYQDNQPYWASDWCYYSVVNATWTGNQCIRTNVDANGTAVPGTLIVYAYDPATTDHLGAATLQLDLRDPQYLYFRSLTSAYMADGRWARQAAGDASAPVDVQVWDAARRRWTWSTMTMAQFQAELAGTSTGTSTGTTDGGVIGGGYGSGTGNWEIDAMMNRFNYELNKIWVAPNCTASYNGCG